MRGLQLLTPSPPLITHNTPVIYLTSYLGHKGIVFYFTFAKEKGFYAPFGNKC